MESSIVKKAGEFLKEKKARRRWMAAVALLAVAAVGATAWALMSPARAMMGEVYCNLEEHVHTEECYELVLTCGYEEGAVVLTSMDSEGEAHQHDDNCFELVRGTDLVCGQEETEGHSHTDDCYTVTEVESLICGQEGEEGHEHTDECYSVTEEKSLTCDQEETEGHSHTDDCYEMIETLVCEKEESEGAEELQEAPVESAETHEHTDECYELVLTCELEEHEHTDECYKVPAYYCADRIHSHTEECRDEEGNLICGQADFVVHVHNDDCVDLKGNIICPLEEVEAHEHTSECYDQDNNLICGNEEILLHTHGAACYDEKGGLVCGQLEVLEHVHSGECTVEIEEVPETIEGGTITKAYDGFVITAVYGPEAGLPKGVRLVAEQITAETDAEHYAAREAEYQEEAGENSVMHALLKVGFYVNGKEIEPEGPVTITVQFLDENGLPEGSPVTVVHFGESGTEVLNGSDAESGSTTFEMNSFSEIAIGYRKNADGTVSISETFEYEDDAFHIDFQVEGTVTLPATADAEKNDIIVEESVDETENTDTKTEEGIKRIESELGFEFEVIPQNANSSEFDEATETAEQVVGLTGDNELVDAYAITYSLNYNGVKLDLSECKITAAMTPVLKEKETPASAETDLKEGEENPEDDVIMGTQYVFVGVLETGTTNLLDTMYAEESSIMLLDVSDTPTIVVYEYKYKVGQVNPHFSVQYYAYVDQMKTITDKEKLKFTNNSTYQERVASGIVPIINTAGGILPKNGTGVWTTEGDTSVLGLVVKNGIFESENKLTRVYASREFTYLSAPNLNYMNALLENQHYQLKEIWVADGNAHPELLEVHSEHLDGNENTSYDVRTNVTEDSISSGWKVYSKDTRFTNGDVTDENYIKISQNTIIRLVYEVVKEQENLAVDFYDYDITDGTIYRSREDALAETNGMSTNIQGDGTWYVNTYEKGINASGNYHGSGVKLAFGNALEHHGSTYGNAVWEDRDRKKNKLNRHNQNDDGTGSFLGCTFGLAVGLDNKGNIKYADGVAVPHLFNDEDENEVVSGKTSYDNGEYELQFSRKGDTYTLHAVTKKDGSIVTTDNDLEKVNHPNSTSDPEKAYTHIWTNNFWPMDYADSYGTAGHDFKFGSNAKLSKRWWVSKDSEGNEIAGSNYGGEKYTTTNQFVVSDDGRDHNSYFGMHYQVRFTLCADYIGPLEYYFFGDDDMWVFLTPYKEDGKTLDYSATKLICDIGGTHSSVGEYVNLWDYVTNDWQTIQEQWTGWTPEERVANEVPTKEYMLSFYYTERGDAGSTCWMQFTLPQVTTMRNSTNSSNFGDLEVKKVVTTSEDNFVPEDEEFVFTIELFSDEGRKIHLTDNYSYIKYKNDGNVVADLIVNNRENAFTLKNGEYVIIKNLPVNAYYTISEVGVAEYSPDETAYNSVPSRYDYLTDVYITKDGAVRSSKPEGDGNKTIEGQIKAGVVTNANVENIIVFNNMLDVYRLPKTGSSGGMLCTIIGSLCVLLAAVLACVKNRKLMKQFVGVFLAAAMFLGMSSTASAAENEGSVAGLVPGIAKQHTYEIYQLFTGDYSNEMLARVKYGESIIGKAGQTVDKNILNQLNALYEQYKDNNANKEVQKIAELAGFVDKATDDVKASVPMNLQPTVSSDGKKITYTGLATGYYLVKDKNDSLNGALGETYTLYIIRLVDGASGTLEVELTPPNGRLEAEPKSAVPEVEKHIIEGNERVDVNNVSIGDSVRYELKGTLPDNFDDFNTYYYEFTDKLTKGLTYNDDVKIMIGSTDVTKYFYRDHKPDVPVDSDGDTIITIAIDDLKQLKNVGVNVTADSEIVVTYSATLNKNAVIAGAGNPNYAMLTYSNDPNHSGDGRTAPPPENPDKPTPDPTRPIGKTPIYEVRTFTTQLTIEKVDGTHENAHLADVEFTLTGNGVNVVLESGTFYTENSEGTFYRLKDGTYTDVSPETEDIEKNDYVQEDDGSYKTYTKTPFAGLKEGDSDADDFAKDESKDRAIVAVTDENGLVSFTGLAAGEYTITETKTPEGYTPIDPITFTIKFQDTSANGVLSGNFSVENVSDYADKSTVNGINVSEGKLSVTIKNYLGTLLPSTGGTGTKVFYVCGGILVAAAVVLLVFKNRKSIKKEEE